MDHAVSVVIPYTPNYTPAGMLEEAIESVYTQKLTTEVIVVTPESIDHLAAEVTEVTDNCERGPGWARNKGMDAAKHRYIAFLDADDTWKEDKLIRQISEMNAQNVGLCLEGKDKPAEQFIEAVIKGNVTSVTSSIMIDTSKVSTKFNQNLPRYEDHLFLIQSASEGGICLLPNLKTTRKHNKGLSANTTKKDIDSVVTALDELMNKNRKESYIQEFVKWRLYMCGVHYRKMGYYKDALRSQIRSVGMGPTRNNIRALLSLPIFWARDKT